jgi:hypothetical protein
VRACLLVNLLGCCVRAREKEQARETPPAPLYPPPSFPPKAKTTRQTKKQKRTPNTHTQLFPPPSLSSYLHGRLSAPQNRLDRRDLHVHQRKKGGAISPLHCCPPFPLVFLLLLLREQRLLVGGVGDHADALPLDAQPWWCLG